MGSEWDFSAGTCCCQVSVAFSAQLLPVKGLEVGTAALNLSFQKRRTTGGRKHPVTRKGLLTAKVGENPDL